MIKRPPKPYFVAPVFYYPVQHAIFLINQGHSKSDAIQIAIDKFAYYGKNNSKRLKSFDITQFTRHVNRFINTPNAYLVRRSPKHR